MLPTLVIGLREGLEAALIVGIIAAFLKRQGRRDLLRQTAAGVGLAVLLCVLVGLGLEMFSRDLPQRQQEGLETVIGVLAVGMVTYMVVWMKENSRGLKAQLESAAAQALAGGGSRAGRAMVLMAFLAVLREGFETVVFLLAAFNEAEAGPAALFGALLGIAVAVALGYGIYRGGVRLNLSRFFRATGLVLVLVAAGLVVSALHTAHEAGWLNIGQQRVLDLSWLVQPGSVLSSVLTGMLGLQPFPTLAEVIGWLVYLVPVGIFVAWPPHRTVPLRGLARGLTATALALVAAGLALGLLATPTPPARPTTTAGDLSARLVASDQSTATVRTRDQRPLEHRTGATRSLRLTHAGTATVHGTSAQLYSTRMSGPGQGPARLSTSRAAALNGGRLPVGVVPDEAGTLSATYRTTRVLEVAVEPRTGRVLQVHWSAREQVLLAGPGGGAMPLAEPLRSASLAFPPAAAAAAAQAARADLADLDRHSTLTGLAWLLGCLGLAAAGCAALAERRRRRIPAPALAPGSPRELASR